MSGGDDIYNISSVPRFKELVPNPDHSLGDTSLGDRFFDVRNEPNEPNEPDEKENSKECIVPKIDVQDVSNFMQGMSLISSSTAVPVKLRNSSNFNPSKDDKQSAPVQTLANISRKSINSNRTSLQKSAQSKDPYVVKKVLKSPDNRARHGPVFMKRSASADAAHRINLTHKQNANRIFSKKNTEDEVKPWSRVSRLSNQSNQNPSNKISNAKNVGKSLSARTQIGAMKRSASLDTARVKSVNIVRNVRDKKYSLNQNQSTNKFLYMKNAPPAANRKTPGVDSYRIVSRVTEQSVRGKNANEINHGMVLPTNENSNSINKNGEILKVIEKKRLKEMRASTTTANYHSAQRKSALIKNIRGGDQVGEIMSPSRSRPKTRQLPIGPVRVRKSKEEIFDEKIGEVVRSRFFESISRRAKGGESLERSVSRKPSLEVAGASRRTLEGSGKFYKPNMFQNSLRSYGSQEPSRISKAEKDSEKSQKTNPSIVNRDNASGSKDGKHHRTAAEIDAFFKRLSTPKCIPARSDVPEVRQRRPTLHAVHQPSLQKK